MNPTLEILAVSYPTRGEFKISRSTVSQVDVVEVRLTYGEHVGRGECRPYARYGDTVASVTAQLQGARSMLTTGHGPQAIKALPAGPARNALDCAWLDLMAKQSGRPVWQALGLAKPQPRQTAFTLSWDTAEVMAEQARAAALYPWLKLKIGQDGWDRVRAVAEARPGAQLILDANEAMTSNTLAADLDRLNDLNIALVEQPLPAGHSESLPNCSFPICADEGLHGRADLLQLWEQGYRAVNVKLDKCGGLTEGVALIREAKSMGFTVMAGCMVGSSLAMAPMMVAESLCDIIDLDGPLLLGRDIENGLHYDGPIIHPPKPELWG